MASKAGGSQCHIDSQLGKGSFGVVYRLICSQSPPQPPARLALKVIDQDWVRDGQDEQELSIMSRLQHPNIVSLLDSFQLEVPQGRFLMMVLELCEEGDLSQYLATLRRRGVMGADEVLVVKWTLQMTDAVKYLHGQKIIHRDLKPQNIFMKDKSNLRIGDLGIARQLLYTRQKAASQVGTPVYMSPEIFKGQHYSYETDIWSLGCCVFEMMALKSAFSDRSLFYLTDEIINKEVVPPAHYSQPLRRLVLDMLSKSPRARPQAGALLTSLLKLDGTQAQATRRPEEEIEGRTRRSLHPQFTEDWRSKTAQAVFTFRAERAASQFAEVSAALAKKTIAASESGSGQSSGGMTSLRPGRTSRGPDSGEQVDSESSDMDGQYSSDWCDSGSLSSTGGDDRTWGNSSSSTQVERRSSGAVEDTLSSGTLSQREGTGGRAVLTHRTPRQPGKRPARLSRQGTDSLSQTEGTGGRVALTHRSPRQSGERSARLYRQGTDSLSQTEGTEGRVLLAHSSPRQSGERPARLIRQGADSLCDDSSGGGGGAATAASSDSEDSDDSPSTTVVPTTRLKIGKSSMVVRARPLPQPRRYREWAEENSLENLGSLSAGVQPGASISENDATPSVISSHAGDGSSRHQKTTNKDVDMAYANEVLQWARARLLPSSETQANSSQGVSRPASVGAAGGSDTETVSSTVKDVVGKRGVRNGAVATGRHADVVTGTVTRKEATAQNAVGDMTVKETDAAEREWQTQAGVSSPGADSTAAAPVPLGPRREEEKRAPVKGGKGKKKKNKVFLRGKESKAEGGQAKSPSPRGRVSDSDGSKQAAPHSVYQETRKMMVDNCEETVVVLYPRGHRVTFSKDSVADYYDLSIGGHSYT